MTTYAPAADRVAKGAAWLDEHYPTWARQLEHVVDHSLHLNLANPDDCVLGQIATAIAGPTANFYSLVEVATPTGKYEGFHVNECLDALMLETRITGEESIELGFDISPLRDHDGQEEEYATLEILWRHEIGERV